MATAILIGDSIRIGYAPDVVEELAGAFEVVAPKENCANSRHTLAHLEDWVIRPTLAADGPVALHVNCGLHDLAYKRLADGNVPADGPDVALSEYRANVEAILRRTMDEAKLPADHLIWASTTPVIDDRHRAAKPFLRLDADVSAYNEAAAAVVSETGCRFNDLNAVVKSHGGESLMTPDGVHYTPAGSAVLGKAVASAIRTAVSER